MAFHTLFFLFVLMFYSGISQSDEDSASAPWDTNPNGKQKVRGDDSCKSQQDKSEKLTNDLGVKFPENCKCAKKGNNTIDVQNCVAQYTTCWRACQEQVGACARDRDIDISDGCESYCQQPPFNASRLSQSRIVDECTRKKVSDIKSQLKDDCLSMIQKIPKPNPGAVLVCPNQDCSQYCNSVADRESQQMGRLCRDGITSQGGYDSCLAGLRGQLNKKLPQSPGRLSRGFAWENCDLGKPCEQELSLAFQQTVRECGALKERAVLCCNKPMECHKTPTVTGAIPPPSAFGLGMGMSDICRIVKEKTGDVGKLGQKLAEECRNSSKKGLAICRQKTQRILASFYQLCSFDLNTENVYDPGLHTCGKNMIDKYVQNYGDKIRPLFASIETAGLKAGELEKQAKGFLESSLVAADCEKSAGVLAGGGEESSAGSKARGSDGLSDLSGFESGGFSPSEAGGYVRGGPGASEEDTDPAFGGAGDSGGGVGGAGGRRRAQAGARDAGARITGSKGVGRAGVTGGAGGMGAGTGAGSGKASGMGAGTGTGSGRTSGASRTGGVGGASGSNRRLSSKERGFREFQQAGSGSDSSKVKSFLDRPPAIRNKKIHFLGSPHDDIFKRISNRIIYLCRTKYIEDCDI